MADPNLQRLLVGELDAVYRLAYHLAACPQDADDFVQETFLRALKAADHFELRDFGPRPWLFKILHNVVTTRYKTQQRDRRLHTELVELGTPEIATPPDQLTALRWDEIDERLKHAIHELPTDARMTFLLHAIEGLKYREIADVTDVPVGTVMSRLSRVRGVLLEKLRTYALERGWQRPAADVVRTEPTDNES